MERCGALDGAMSDLADARRQRDGAQAAHLEADARAARAEAARVSPSHVHLVSLRILNATLS